MSSAGPSAFVKLAPVHGLLIFQSARPHPMVLAPSTKRSDQLASRFTSLTHPRIKNNSRLLPQLGVVDQKQRPVGKECSAAERTWSLTSKEHYYSPGAVMV